MVCAVEGLPHRNRYRRFRIRTVEGSDDPAMMAEVLRRRFSRAGQPEWTVPDMVLVDGGITQLRAARAVLADLGFPSLPAAGLAKQFESIHWGPVGAERILSLPLDSPALTVLRALRDEAHRFALTYHRRLRHQRLRESALDTIEGIGTKRKALLLSRFGSVRRLSNAPVESIAAVPGIGPALAKAIADALPSGGPRYQP
jgi:excinuclease ABC subunit C